MPEKIGVGDTLRAAFGFWRSGVKAAPGVLTLCGVATAWLYHVSASPDPGVQLTGLIPYAIMATLAEAAMLRAWFGAQSPDEPDYRVGPLGFQFGKIEVMVLASRLLCGALLVFVGMLLLLVLGAFLISLGVAAGAVPKTPEELLALGPNLWLVILVLAVGLFFFTWLNLRLSLASAASAAERRVVALSAFGMTRGHFWMLFACQLLIRLPMLGLSFLVGQLLTGLTGSAPAVGSQLQAVSLLALGVVSAFYLTPLMAGISAYVYGRLGPAPAKPGANP